MESDVYSQIGLVMLIGLAAKNAILIVEFAKDELEKGKPLMDAALEGARLRLRPILMTSFAFILGCVPLWIATGAGAVSRQIMGTTVIGGMLAASFIGIFIIPVGVLHRRKALGQRAAAPHESRGHTAAVAGARGLIPCIGELHLRASLLVLCGCTVGPNYQRPKLATPAQFRAPEPLPVQEAFSLADLKWFELFHDEQLQALIRTALVQNYDLRDAVARVEEARANLGITRSESVSTIRRRAAAWKSTVSRATALSRFPQCFCPRRIATSEKRRSTCSRSKSICGAGCAAPPKPRAPIF